MNYRLLLIVLMGALSSHYVNAKSIADVPTPHGVELAWVGQQINQNGMPMDVQSLRSRMDVEKIISYYRQAWADPVAEGAPGFVENKTGDWTVISRFDGTTNMVVQVKPGAAYQGSEGFISVTRLADMKTAKHSFSPPPGAQLVSQTESLDNNITAETYIFKSTQGAKFNSDHYISSLKNQGFEYVHGVTEGQSHVLFFNGKKSQIEISIGENPDGGSVIFLNYKKM